MRLSRTLAATLLSFLAGCGSALGPVSRSFVLTPDVALIAFTSDLESYSDTLVAANAQRLFVCVVAVCPGLRGVFRGGSDSFYGHLATSSWTWQTNVGDVSLSMLWDQRADTVEIGSVRYSRIAGNTFIARYQHPGHWTVQQIASIPLPRTPTSALEQIQQQLHDDPLIASLALRPELTGGIIQRP